MAADLLLQRRQFRVQRPQPLVERAQPRRRLADPCRQRLLALAHGRDLAFQPRQRLAARPQVVVEADQRLLGGAAAAGRVASAFGGQRRGRAMLGAPARCLLLGACRAASNRAMAGPSSAASAARLARVTASCSSMCRRRSTPALWPRRSSAAAAPPPTPPPAAPAPAPVRPPSTSLCRALRSCSAARSARSASSRRGRRPCSPRRPRAAARLGLAAAPRARSATSLLDQAQLARPLQRRRALVAGAVQQAARQQRVAGRVASTTRRAAGSC